MILRYSLLSFGLIAFGTVIGVILVNGPRGAWYWLLDSLEPARHRAVVFFMPATGERAHPRETGPLNVLPEQPEHPRYGTLLNDTPAEGTQVPVQGAVLTVGKHERTQPREDAEPVMGDRWLHEVRAERDAFQRPDVADLFYDAAQREGISVPPSLYDRFADAEREMLFGPCPTPAHPSPSMLPLTGPIPRIHASDRPQYGQAPVAGVLAAGLKEQVTLS